MSVVVTASEGPDKSIHFGLRDGDSQVVFGLSAALVYQLVNLPEGGEINNGAVAARMDGGVLKMTYTSGVGVWHFELNPDSMGWAVEQHA